jgi:Protein of unknown function (DUF1326)
MGPTQGAAAAAGAMVGVLGIVALLTAQPALASSRAAPAPQISGDYLEARTADVYTGPCFANSEMDLVGKQAVVAWRVRQGGWQGVPLDGLAVVAAVRAAKTLGDPFGGPPDAAALIVVDRRATPAQRDALVAFARSMAPDLLSSIVAVERAPIEMAVGGGEGVAGAAGTGAEHGAHLHHPGAVPAAAGISGEAHLLAGDRVSLATRALGPQDHLCGNEEVFYPPLTAERSRVTAVPAVTVEYDFRGPGLGMVWSSPGKRSAFVGRFAR